MNISAIFHSYSTHKDISSKEKRKGQKQEADYVFIH